MLLKWLSFVLSTRKLRQSNLNICFGGELSLMRSSPLVQIFMDFDAKGG